MHRLHTGVAAAAAAVVVVDVVGADCCCLLLTANWLRTQASKTSKTQRNNYLDALYEN